MGVVQASTLPAHPGVRWGEACWPWPGMGPRIILPPMLCFIERTIRRASKEYMAHSSLLAIKSGLDSYVRGIGQQEGLRVPKAPLEATDHPVEARGLSCFSGLVLSPCGHKETRRGVTWSCILYTSQAV